MSHVTEKYRFRTATRDDAPILLESVLTGFLKSCPHAQALNVSPNQAREFLTWIVERSLHKPYSLVGFRLYSVSQRDESEDYSPFDLDFASMTKNMQILGNILDTQKNKIWSLCPSAKKVLRQEITFVDPLHQRRGIARHLLNLLNIDQMKADGFAGIQSEATSHANQQMLAKLGYTVLSESEPHEYFWPDGSSIILPDETKSVQLFFLPIF